jgi:hypothetical protein
MPKLIDGHVFKSGGGTAALLSRAAVSESRPREHSDASSDHNREYAKAWSAGRSKAVDGRYVS